MPIESSNDPKSFRDFEHKGWETVSDGYQNQFARLTNQSVPALLNAAEVSDGMRVLDVCCGPGMISANAARRKANTVGVDFSDAFLALARNEVPGVEFRKGDAQSLDFDDETFDAVVCGFGVVHLPEPAKALSEFRRVVRKGGRVAISTWEAPKPSNGFGLLFGAIKTHGNLNVDLPHGPDFFQFSDSERMTAALEECGLSGVEVIEIEQTWEFENADGLLNGILEGAVRARALLKAQSEEAFQAIREAVRSGMTKFEIKAGRFEVPMPAIIGVGRKS